MVWKWLRERKGILFGICGGIVLFIYGIIPTFSLHILEEYTQLMEEYLLSLRFFGGYSLTRKGLIDTR
jgi:hypothetical protein